MCSAADSADIIILSDDDNDSGQASGLKVEDTKKKDEVSSPSSLEEDLVITFSRRADVLPHARYDCPIHPFTTTESETKAPVASNHCICEQCFCYVCDKLASSCKVWRVSGICHCNSHQKSEFWTKFRKFTQLGGLLSFDLNVSEMDSHLRLAERWLQRFKRDLKVLFHAYTDGKTPQQCGLTQVDQNILVFNYTNVFDYVSLFLNKAEQQESRAAAVMSLGAAEEFLQHFELTGGYKIPSPRANTDEAKKLLLQRVVASVQKRIVKDDFTPDFTSKLQDFYKNLAFTPELRSMKNSLCIRPWDDVLLVSVLKGQNVSGVRRDKGKRDTLIEQISVVLLRAELLQRQSRYRELCRYLRVVQTDDTTIFQQLQDLIPYFTCMAGNFSSALSSLFPMVNAPASRLTPHLFLFYLRIFETGTAPKLIVSKPAHLCSPSAVWESITDAVPLKRPELVKFALRAQRCCPAVHADSQCWTSLLTIVKKPRGSLTTFPVPNSQFLQEARDIVNSILLDQHSSCMQIPRAFHEVYPDQALLLLVTGALSLRIQNSAPYPILPVINAFEENPWAFKWLCDSLSSNEEHLVTFFQKVAQELENTPGGGHLFSFLRSNIPPQSSGTSTPSAGELNSSQGKPSS